MPATLDENSSRRSLRLRNGYDRTFWYGSSPALTTQLQLNPHYKKLKCGFFLQREDVDLNTAANYITQQQAMRALVRIAVECS